MVDCLEKDRFEIPESFQRALLGGVAWRKLALERETRPLEEVHPSLRFRPIVLILCVALAEHLVSLYPLNLHASAQGKGEKKLETW